MDRDQVLVGLLALMFVINSVTIVIFADRLELVKSELQIVNQNLEFFNELNDLNKNFSIKVAGRYYTGNKNIAIYTNENNPDYIIDIAEHEMGHYLWYEFLTKKQKDEYKLIFNKTNIYVSDYAETSVEEDFSETMLHYLQSVTQIKKIPHDRQEFFENNIETYFN